MSFSDFVYGPGFNQKRYTGTFSTASRWPSEGYNSFLTAYPDTGNVFGAAPYGQRCGSYYGTHVARLCSNDLTCDRDGKCARPQDVMTECAGCLPSKDDPSNCYKIVQNGDSTMRVPCNTRCCGKRPQSYLNFLSDRSEGTARINTCEECSLLLSPEGNPTCVRFNNMGVAIQCPSQCCPGIPRWVEYSNPPQPREWEQYSVNPQFYGKFITRPPKYPTLPP